MATWSPDNVILTKVGSEILSKVQVGQGKITIAKIVTGGGFVPPAQLYNQTAVTDEKQEMSILNYTTDENGSSIEVQISNDDLTEEYSLYQIGVYVTHQDYTGNQLYLIAQCDTSDPDVIPLPSETPASLNYSLYVEHNNTSNVEIVVDPSGTVSNSTFNTFKEEVTQQITVINGSVDDLEERVLALETEGTTLEVLNVTLPAANWSESSAGVYTQTYSSDSISEESFLTVQATAEEIIAHKDEDVVEIALGEPTAGSVVVYAICDVKPTVDYDVEIVVQKKQQSGNSGE